MGALRSDKNPVAIFMLGTESRLIKTTLTIWLYVMAYPVMQAWFVRASFFTQDLTIEDWRVLRFKQNVDRHKR